MRPVLIHSKCFVLLITSILLLSSGCANHLFYRPNKVVYTTPEQHQLKYEAVYFKSKDGTRLYGWFIPAAGKAVGTVIYFYGNFGNLTYAFDQIKWLPDEGFNVFTFDYRGYGRSDGQPFRRGIIDDSIAAINFVRTKPGIEKNSVYVFGQSLGGANAVAAIALDDYKDIQAIALEGTFCSYREEARDMMESTTREKVGNIPLLSWQVWLVSFFAVTNSFSPQNLIGRIAPIPILLVHGTFDQYVLYHHSDCLYNHANKPKYRLTIPDGQHLDTFTDNKRANQYRTELIQFFKTRRVEEGIAGTNSTH
jgi:fermentation-respiration switch protein FrsA (DUF1100 family)